VPLPRPVLGLWAFTAALVLCHLLTPDGPLDDATYLLAVGVAPLVAWLGTRRAAPGARLVPWLITAGIAASALGDLLWDIRRPVLVSCQRGACAESVVRVRARLSGVPAKARAQRASFVGWWLGAGAHADWRLRSGGNAARAFRGPRESASVASVFRGVEMRAWAAG
jgi:hypothetical protein